MKNTTLNRLEIWHRCVLIGLTACFSTLSPAQAEEEVAEPFRLELIPNKVEFKVGEPISVQVKLINLTGRLVKIRGRLKFGGSLGIDYKHQNDRMFWPYSMAFIIDSFSTALYMVPVEGLTFNAFLAFDSMKRKRNKPSAIFDKAGNYIFKASFWPFTGKQLWSDEIIVSVTEPTGVDALALEQWMDEFVLWAVQGYKESDADKGVEKLRALVAEYPTSIYGQYAQRELAYRDKGLEGITENPQSRAQMEEVRTREEEWIQKPPQSERVAAPASEPEAGGKEDWRIKIGAIEFPIIFEDGNYENLDKANLIWTVNNLLESASNLHLTEDDSSFKFQIDGREVEANFYLRVYNNDEMYAPKLEKSYSHDILEEDGVYYLVLSREFIEAYIEASKYEAIKDELNAFIDRLNRIQSADLDTLTEAEIDAMMFVDPRIADKFVGVEKKRERLRKLTVDKHFQSINVFTIGEGAEIDLYFMHGDDGESLILGVALYYKTEDNLSSGVSREEGNSDLPLRSNFNPRFLIYPDEKPFILEPDDSCYFIYDNRQWKIYIF